MFEHDGMLDAKNDNEAHAEVVRTESEQLELSKVLVRLSKGVLYMDKHPDLWNTLSNHERVIQSYFSQLGLDFIVNKTEGYAFLRQGESEDLPQVMTRRRLTLGQSLLLLLLRERFQDHEIQGTDPRLIVHRSDMIEWLTPFFPGNNNEIAQERQFGGYITRCVELGFLVKLKSNPNDFEVQKVIKSFVDINFTSRILEEFKTHLGLDAEEADDPGVDPEGEVQDD